MATPSRGLKFGQQNLILLVGALNDIRQKSDLSKVTLQKLKADLEQVLKIYIPTSTLITTVKQMGINLKEREKGAANLNGSRRFETLRKAVIELADSLGHLSPAITELKNLK